MMHLLALLTAATLASSAPAAASPAVHTSTARRWDATGHRAMAAMAYDRLRPATRARVDELLRVHPDLALLTVGVEINTAAGIREVFLRASVWPDRIRGDARFWRETDPKATPTPLLPGFPTMASRDGWHYLTRSFSTDGTPPLTLAEPNVVTAFPAMAESLRDNAVPSSVRAYNLSWIIHIVGDLHQPVHGTSRSSVAHPNGDAGANRVWVRLPEFVGDSINLHAVWDGWLGRPTRGQAIDDVAAALARDLPIADGQPDDALTIPQGAALAGTVQGWADESAALARYVAYDIPTREGSAPPMLTEAYVAQGTRIARHRLALSAYRLAAVIEAQLGE